MNSLTSSASFPMRWAKPAVLVLDELRGLESELLLSRGCQAKGTDSLVVGQLMWWVTQGSRTGAPLLSPTFDKGPLSSSLGGAGCPSSPPCCAICLGLVRSH